MDPGPAAADGDACHEPDLGRLPLPMTLDLSLHGVQATKRSASRLAFVAGPIDSGSRRGRRHRMVAPAMLDLSRRAFLCLDCRASLCRELIAGGGAKGTYF